MRIKRKAPSLSSSIQKYLELKCDICKDLFAHEDEQKFISIPGWFWDFSKGKRYQTPTTWFKYKNSMVLGILNYKFNGKLQIEKSFQFLMSLKMKTSIMKTICPNAMGFQGKVCRENFKTLLFRIFSISPSLFTLPLSTS